ncbi:hypothetical protein [Pyrobaculum islandicum]|uniref:hypothetical protein n=1 Tax=Pyrobaculum islandicum TaxID=2277 RepID=UPI00069CFB18|nr:hypothetical protein [Pyrobaculum islandicum]
MAQTRPHLPFNYLIRLSHSDGGLADAATTAITGASPLRIRSALWFAVVAMAVVVLVLSVEKHVLATLLTTFVAARDYK